MSPITHPVLRKTVSVQILAVTVVCHVVEVVDHVAVAPIHGVLNYTGQDQTALRLSIVAPGHLSLVLVLEPIQRELR